VGLINDTFFNLLFFCKKRHCLLNFFARVTEMEKIIGVEPDNDNLILRKKRVKPNNDTMTYLITSI